MAVSHLAILLLNTAAETQPQLHLPSYEVSSASSGGRKSLRQMPEAAPV